MTLKTDPFTRTPGIAGRAYIDNGIADEIIKCFLDEESAKFVFKITGLRGSGKSVEYGRIIRELKDEKNWLVYPLSASGEAVRTLISKLSMESFIDDKTVTTVTGSATSVSGGALVVSGNETINVQKTISDNERLYSEEATLTNMISIANKKKYKVLVGVDDISKTPDMVRLLSIIGSMILEGLRVYLVVTGLSENIEDFSGEENLSFFKRADSREVSELNKYDVTYMYQKLLGIDLQEARQLEEISRGYAYAYQVLGSLYFAKAENETIDDVIPDFERILFRDSYELIWRSLSKGEKEVVRCILKAPHGRTDEIRALMSNPNTYPVYRSRLINKHLANADSRGYLSIRLPSFDRFVEVWGDD
ncbi:MAG: hypothetical protein IJ058_02130 [Lachnospiraceae bacterium]|nr:hypothetical protein [Lachnospiraceae bacterium]